LYQSERRTSICGAAECEQNYQLDENEVIVN
jgi:hypothetical protein